MKSKVNDVMKEANSYNTECAEMANSFDQTITRAAEKLWQCVTDATKLVDGPKENIQEKFDLLLRHSENIKQKSELCAKNVTDEVSVAQAYFCVNRVGYLFPYYFSLLICHIINQINSIRKLEEDY